MAVDLASLCIVKYIGINMSVAETAYKIITAILKVELHY